MVRGLRRDGKGGVGVRAGQLVPPPPITASFAAFVMTLSRGFKSTSTTSFSNGNTGALPCAVQHAAKRRYLGAGVTPRKSSDCTASWTQHELSRPGPSGTHLQGGDLTDRGVKWLCQLNRRYRPLKEHLTNGTAWGQQARKGPELRVS